VKLFVFQVMKHLTVSFRSLPTTSLSESGDNRLRMKTDNQTCGENFRQKHKRNTNEDLSSLPFRDRTSVLRP
jgi:hypothetical protein